LNSQDRLYCAEGRCGSYNEATLKNRIRNDRINQFPERFQDLIDDITLIHYSDEDFLTSSEWDQLWVEIADVDTRATKISEDNILPPSGDSDDAQFGFELGHALKLIGGLRSSERLIWGFLLGILPGGTHNIETQIGVINTLLDSYERKAENRYQKAQDEISRIETENELREEAKKRINQILRDNGIEDTANEIGIVGYFRDRMVHCKPGFNLEEAIQSYIDNRHLVSVDNLRQQLKEDSKIIETKKKQGVKVRDVTQCLYSKVRKYIRSQYTISPPIPTEMKKCGVNKNEFPYSQRNHHMLVAALNRLSDKDDSELYTNKPVVRQVNNRWALTSYGQLLTYTTFDENDSKWVYQYSRDLHSLNRGKRYLIEKFVL
jgi:hypothetical protein